MHIVLVYKKKIHVFSSLCYFVRSLRYFISSATLAVCYNKLVVVADGGWWCWKVGGGVGRCSWLTVVVLVVVMYGGGGGRWVVVDGGRRVVDDDVGSGGRWVVGGGR